MISLPDLRANSALLKLDLYCKGLRLDDSCLVEEDGGRKILRTRAGLGSGARGARRLPSGGPSPSVSEVVQSGRDYGQAQSLNVARNLGPSE